MKNVRVLGLALLLLTATACGFGDRKFKTPKTLSEGRLVRKTTMPLEPNAALGDEPFRATPPGRVPAKVRPLAAPTEARLSNGIRVVMLERHDFPAISAVIMLDKGSTAAAPGVVSLYEAAMTGTSDEYKAADAWSYLSFVGATVESDGWHDAMSLQVTALTPLFVSALSRAAPMFTVPSFDGDDLDEARTHLTAARARAGENPARVARDAVYAAVFPPPHPYAVPVSGQPARLGKISEKEEQLAEARVTNDQVRKLRDLQLSADHVVVAVVGDFKPAFIQRILEKALGKLAKKPPADTPAFPPLVPKSGRKLMIIDRPGAAQSTVEVGFPGPRGADPEIIALEVLGAATAGDLSTRLNVTVRKELGASYGVHMSVQGLHEGGILRISAAVDTPRTVDAVRRLFLEIERLRKEPLSSEELTAAKLRSAIDFEHGSTHGIAHYLAHSLSEGLPPAYVVSHNARVDVVSAEGVRAAAERWLSPDEAHVVVVGDASRILEGLRGLDLGEPAIAAAR